MEEEILTVKELARYLKMDEHTVYIDWQERDCCRRQKLVVSGDLRKI